MIFHSYSIFPIKTICKNTDYVNLLLLSHIFFYKKKKYIYTDTNRKMIQSSSIKSGCIEKKTQEKNKLSPV